MKKKLFDYLISIGFNKSNLPVYQCFTKGNPRQCLVFAKGRLTHNKLIDARHFLVAWGYLTEQEFDRIFAPTGTSKSSTNMRKLMLVRIEELRQQHGFSLSSARWQNVYYVEPKNQKKTHIEELDFNVCSDEELLLLFERIIIRYNKQM